MRSILERFILVSGRFTVSGITQGKVREFEGFLKGEHLLQDKYPAVYDQVKRAVKPRGQNTINSKMNILRAFVHHLIRVGYLGVDPFQHYETAPDMYSDPVPLTPREVEALLTFEGLSPVLAMVRDMFCLHCYIGCRVGDFVALRRENVQEDILSYIPRKTAGENPSTVYVPLIDKAREIIARYNYPDGRLLPFINVNGKGGYNKRIKELCRLAGLTRQVVVLNTLTRQQQTKPLHDVVSSHTARRTFINSNYAQLQDPALISKMTGHSENSRAFSRYRNIDMDILRSQVKKAFHSTNLAGE
jgi:integrase